MPRKSTKVPRLVSAPDPHVTPARKRVWYLTVGILGCAESACSENWYQIAGFDIKVVPLVPHKGSAASAARHAHARTGRPDIDDSKLVQNHMIVRSNYTINVHMLTQHNQEIASFVLGSREGLGPRLFPDSLGPRPSRDSRTKEG